ncbi:MAG: redox-sensing transcriptional repressor Rex, partial [Muribaculaceae bacterium]|nr:redox-sensing transcriptional repressor Rex [Muribaculaceae bacterium]
GLDIVAGIDVDPSLVGSEIAGIHIYHPDDMERVIAENGVTIGIIAVPANSAQDMADRLVEAGIKALWNFTPRRLRAPKDVVITNTSIYSHLAVMYNRLHQQ